MLFNSLRPFSIIFDLPTHLVTVLNSAVSSAISFEVMFLMGVVVGGDLVVVN